ncbi:MAG: hypothetical protein ACLR7Z_04690 [Bilophila wadsworthia]
MTVWGTAPPPTRRYRREGHASSRRRMFSYIGNTLVLTAWQFTDSPSRRFIEQICDSFNLWLNGLAAREHPRRQGGLPPGKTRAPTSSTAPPGSTSSSRPRWPGNPLHAGIRPVLPDQPLRRVRDARTFPPQTSSPTSSSTPKSIGRQLRLLGVADIELPSSNTSPSP